jgi:polygalacturonase
MIRGRLLLAFLAGIVACGAFVGFRYSGGTLPFGWRINALGDAELEGWAQRDAILARIRPPQFRDRDFDVTRYGAVGDGKTPGGEAIARAIDACARAGGGRVVVPAGEYLTGAIHLKSNVNLHVAEGATLLFSTDPRDYMPVVFSRWEGVECMNYSPLIYAYEQTNIAVTGKGTLDGQADNEHWWPWKGDADGGYVEGGPHQSLFRERLFNMSSHGVPPEKRIMGDGSYLRPPLLQTYRCENVLIEGVTIKRTPFYAIHPVLSRNVTVRGVTVDSHGPNSDGCDPESSRDVLIENCVFDNDDDCLAIKSGRNIDGRRVDTPAENIVIRNCTMIGGHGALVVGSEMSGGVRNVFIEDCTVKGPSVDQGIRLKTNSVRGGTIENIYVRNVIFKDLSHAVFLVDFYYEEGDTGPYTPIVRNIHLDNIASDRSRFAIFARGYARSPIHNVYFNDCRFDGAENGSILQDIDGLHAVNVTVNGQRFESNEDYQPAQAADAGSEDWPTTATVAGFHDDFETSGAVNWAQTKGNWTLIDEGGNKAYESAGEDENRAEAGEQSWADYRVEARVKVADFKGENRVMLCGRYRDGNNYYAAAFYNSPSGVMLELHKKLDKKTLRITRVPVQLREGKWYLLALEMKGTSLRVYFDGQPVIVVRDEAFRFGGVAVITKKARAVFDDINVVSVRGG